MPYVNIRITKEGGTFERRHGFCVSATFILARTKKTAIMELGSEADKLLSPTSLLDPTGSRRVPRMDLGGKEVSFHVEQGLC